MGREKKLVENGIIGVRNLSNMSGEHLETKVSRNNATSAKIKTCNKFSQRHRAVRTKALGKTTEVNNAETYNCRAQRNPLLLRNLPKMVSVDQFYECRETSDPVRRFSFDFPADPERRQKWIDRLKARRVRGERTDPFQFFEVGHEPCHVLKIRILRGRNITKGRVQDFIDTPDPYVVVHINMAPDGRKATHHVSNDPNPEWNEEMTFLLPSPEGTKIVAEISLMDSNYSLDETYGSIEFDVSSLPLEKKESKTFNFNETSEVDIEFYKEIRYAPDLRCSLALCDEEKSFRSYRKKNVQSAMRKFMESRGSIGPRVLRETPTIAVLGSGGGFRAMTGYAGAMKALYDSGVLDCVTYVSGLSGSSWYLATLYAHEKFPEEGPYEVNKEMRNNIQNSPFWLLRPECLLRYSHRLRAKMKTGQPVTFVDVFGMLIGQTLLGPEKMNIAKLSDFHKKIEFGKAPMPVIACLHVRPKTSAMTFHDWVEFNPYEIGIAKYGTFMDTKYFGSKFFMGVLAKQHDEAPLHFLMGVWGSAFSILFNRLVPKNDSRQNGDAKSDEFRQEMEESLSNSIQDFGEEDASDPEMDSDSEENDKFEDAVDDLKSANPPKKDVKKPGILASLWSWGTGAGNGSIEDDPIESRTTKSKSTSTGFIQSIISGVFGSNFMESREYRAGKILNYMRGVSLNKTYPISPFTPSPNDTIAEVGEFQKIHEPIEVRRKKVHLVDAGLTYNSPYPAMLRPQRAIDLIISFDFSARPGENAEPFKEILLAEKWARMHNIPFPKIDRTVFDREGMKECYVFQDERNERAPVILHFVLCNIQFRKFSKPGVPRQVHDKRGDFNVFDNPQKPYSTFNFQYSNEDFDNLHDLMEFNTLLHIDTIVEQISNCIKLRRHSKTRGSINLNDIRNSRHMSDKNKKALENCLGEDGIIPFD